MKLVKNLVGFLGDLKTPKFHPEINWPLKAYCPKIYILCLESVQYVRGSATVVCEVVCTSAGAELFVAVYMFSWDVFKDWIVLQPIFVIKNSWKATFGTNARTRPGRAFAEVAAVWRVFFPGARKPLLLVVSSWRAQWLKVPQKSASLSCHCFPCFSIDVSTNRIVQTELSKTELFIQNYPNRIVQTELIKQN